MTELQKLKACIPYLMYDTELVQMRGTCRYHVKAFNESLGSYLNKEDYLTKLSNLLPNADKTVIIEQPFFCDYGFNIYLQANVFINFGCKLLDAGTIHIGANTLIGPDVNIYASTHPIDKESRFQQIGVARPVIIGSNCWIGGNSTICPGVTIGNNVIVGAGSVVTKNIPENSIVAGNPARIIKRSIEKIDINDKSISV